jgi:uncharacterized DUF497 family protein
MGKLRFSWDPRKARSNERKHGVSFDEATTVFLDERALLLDDPDHSSGEDRFLLLGLSSFMRLLVVCHCVRQGDTIRLINARKATRREQRQYQERLKK